LADVRQARDTLAGAQYPMSQSVLDRLSALCGGQFVLLDREGRVVYTTIALDDDDLAVLGGVPLQSAADLFTDGRVVRLGAGDYFAEQMPVARRDQPSWTDRLIVLYPKHRWWSIAREVATPILIAGGVTMLAAMLVSAMVAARFVRPIRLLRNQADRIADGRFQPVDVPKCDDEIGDLTRSINRMTEKLGRLEDEVRRHERLRVLGQLGAGIAHQLRNAATGARMAVELHQQETPGAADDESLRIALRQLRLMESHVQRLLSLGRDAPSSHDPVSLAKIVEDTAALVGPGCEHAGTRLSCRVPQQPLWVRGDRHWLGQLLMNLVLNATEAASRGADAREAEVAIELAQGPAGHAVLRVTNNGPAPEPAIRDKLFEPFVTDKPDGTGLGLYLVRQVAEQHGGTVRWDRQGDTTCFTVELPMVSEPQMNTDKHG
jgi:signal transduction histidine kinase